MHPMQSKHLFTVPPTPFGYEVMSVAQMAGPGFESSLKVAGDEANYASLFWSDDESVCSLTGNCQNTIVHSPGYESKTKAVLGLKDGSFVVTNNTEISLILSGGNGRCWSHRSNTPLYGITQDPHSGIIVRSNLKIIFSISIYDESYNFDAVYRC
jgi:hypothetical protein